MAREWRIEAATPEHVAQLALEMREADRLEVEASLGVGSLEGLRQSVEAAPAMAWALFLRGELAALFGLVPQNALGPVAVPWVLTGRAVDRHPRAFWQASRELLPAVLDLYPVLIQYVDARYAASLRWLERLGAFIAPPEPYGVKGRSFHPVVLRRSSDV